MSVNLKQSFILMTVVLCVALPAAAQPIIEFQQTAVVASNVSRGAKTCWLVVAHASRGYAQRIVTQSVILHDDDNDGIVRFTTDTDLIRPDSVWVVADLTSGDTTIGCPDPAGVPALPKLTPAVLVSRGAGNDRILMEGELLLFLYVRPGVGAWTAMLDDGDLREPEAKDDGHIAAPLDRLEAVEGSPEPPSHFSPGDVVVVVNPMRFAAGLLQVGR